MKSLLPGEFPEKAFSVRYAAKDLAYARQMAAEHGVRAPGTDHVAALFEKAIEAGEGDRYFPVIARLLAD
jgi:3-hydroxyisobutyrate dehydrogenase-like beta-hydroxyacid dehydrogenase